MSTSLAQVRFNHYAAHATILHPSYQFCQVP